jgi:hypothetical protein
MVEPENSSDPADDLSQRSRTRRKNIIGRSPHQDEYERLILGGWSSLALERYAKFRYGEDIPAKTFRDYRARKKMQVRLQAEARIDPEALVDVVAERAQLIAMQKERIAIDLRHERTMNKLFSTTRNEMELLGKLLDQYKGDLQDLGAFPKMGEILRLGVPQPHPADQGEDRVAPRAKTLGELVSASPDKEMQLARMIHEALGPASTNGHVVDGTVNGDGSDQR